MKKFMAIMVTVAIIGCKGEGGDEVLYRNQSFTLFADRVEQGNFTGKALSATQMVSNYEIPANEYQDANISFKFSINGKDNEMLPGTDHHLTIKAVNGKAESPLIAFGKQYNQPKTEGQYLQPETPFTIRLDMRGVLGDFAAKGFYETAKGDKIYREDFKAVYVAGNTLPMTWDFDNLKNRAELELKDPDGDGIFETTLLLNAKGDLKKIDTAWQLTRDISAFPQYQSPHVIADAIYNMSVEEMEKAVEKDSTLRTGKEWAGVWTRDVSYSIILSMAYMQPQVAKNSLRRKVNGRKRIIQDTGTGGAWPASTDRMIWAVAAWEIFLATGDHDWMKEAYEIIKLSLEDDYRVAYDAQTGLVKGESSFLDWREQTYPKWMQPADIYESQCLGTNAVHFQANRVAAKMARLLNDAASVKVFEEKAAAIRGGINKHLWMEDKGYYGQYLYGRFHKLLSPRSEALGEALSVVFDIADATRRQKIVSSTPVVDFGIPCIYPQIPGLPPYHNNAVWPFVQTYWLWAAAKAGNEQSVMQSIAAIYRPAALFLTNKENFVADNGDFSATVINSSNMLWSLSGNISLVHKVLFGIRFTENGLEFHPFVPSALKGTRKLSGFKYRNAVLDIEVEGYGDRIGTFLLDGKAAGGAMFPAGISGRHTVKMILSNGFSAPSTINHLSNSFSPANPIGAADTGNGKATVYRWSEVEGAETYQLLVNGILHSTYPKPPSVRADSLGGMLQLVAAGKNGQLSFASEPLGGESIAPVVAEAELFAAPAGYPYKGFTGTGFVEISLQKNRTLVFDAEVQTEGLYEVAFRYANGNGPINTENKCAIRSLYFENQLLGAIVFPQRGTNEWSAWGISNGLPVRLKAGKQQIVLKMEDWNENMNGSINQAMVDALVLQYRGK